MKGVRVDKEWMSNVVVEKKKKKQVEKLAYLCSYSYMNQCYFKLRPKNAKSDQVES